MTKIAAALAVILAGVFVFPISDASAQRRTQVGSLTCRLRPSVGLIVIARQRLDCRFTGRRVRAERYEGTITRVGLNLGFTAGGRMVWGVLARTRLGPGALTGTYAGASGSVALGVGVGANALIGGSNRSIVLQPLSLQAHVGVNLAAGVAGLRLRHI